MAIAGLDHYALLSSDPERTTRFYEDIVGLKVGFRPPLSFPGVWLYAGEHPVVHIIFGKPIAARETGAVDHLAFKASGDIKGALAKLDAQGIEYSMRKLERSGVVQVFFRDPDGVGVELNFQPEVSY
jgi:catechol 2,3-dioxygenase-like lactoylglutathione lyase family enzyme